MAHPDTRKSSVNFHTTLTGDLAEQAWKLYYGAFAPLNALAVQRHLMTRAEFDQVADDPRVDKVLTHDDAGELVGVATFTRDLDAVPLISPAYFERRFPDLYRRRAIWYIGFVAVTYRARKTPAFLNAFARYYEIAEAEDGIVALDVCAHNENAYHLPQTIARGVRRLSGGDGKAERADSQSYWLFDMRGNHLP